MEQFSFDLTARRTHITDDEITAALRVFGATRGNLPFFQREFNAWPGRPCTATTIVLRFGTWRAALARAGIRHARGKHYPPEELIARLEDLWRTLGRPPGQKRLAQRDGLSSHPYSRHWGSLRQACIALSRHKSGLITREQLLAGNPKRRAGARAPIPPSLRWQTLRRDHFRCTACGQGTSTHPLAELHVDHILPVSKGGDNAPENLRTLCRKCNQGRGNKP
jgi:hypothetical protein